MENKDMLDWLKWSDSDCNKIVALGVIIGLLSWINPIKNFIKNNGIKLKKFISFYFERIKFLFSNEFMSSVRIANCLQDLNDCRILINSDVIGDEDNKDYMISPILLTIICNVIENEIEDYCHCGNMAYTPINYYDYLYYIRTGKIKDDTLDDRRVNALKNALNLCKDDLLFSYMSVQLDKAGLPWKTYNINIKPKWNI